MSMTLFMDFFKVNNLINRDIEKEGFIMFEVSFKDCTDMDAVIARGKSMDYRNDDIFLKSIINTGSDNIVINAEYLLDNHIDTFINKYCEEYTLTYEEFSHFKYNPKLMSSNYYGTPEFWSIILRVNGMTSILDFNKRTILILKRSFKKSIEELLNLEKTTIGRNKSKLGLK